MSRYHGEKHHKAKLSLETVKAIRASNDPIHVIAKRFGLPSSHVGKIKRREIWQRDA